MFSLELLRYRTFAVNLVPVSPHLIEDSRAWSDLMCTVKRKVHTVGSGCTSTWELLVPCSPLHYEGGARTNHRAGLLSLPTTAPPPCQRKTWMWLKVSCESTSKQLPLKFFFFKINRIRVAINTQTLPLDGMTAPCGTVTPSSIARVACLHGVGSPGGTRSREDTF